MKNEIHVCPSALAYVFAAVGGDLTADIVKRLLAAIELGACSAHAVVQRQDLEALLGYENNFGPTQHADELRKELDAACTTQP